MASNIMVFAAITLATEFVVAAAIMVYAGWLRVSLRRTYWLSAVTCLALAAHQIWLLLAHTRVTDRIIFGQGSAIVMAAFALIQPPLIVVHHHHALHSLVGPGSEG